MAVKASKRERITRPLRRGLVIIVAVITLGGVTLVWQECRAAFIATTSTGMNTVAAATVPNATGLTSDRPCTATAPTLRGVSSTAGTTSYVDATTPATQAGDLLLAFVVATDKSDPITALDTGWTAVGGQVTSAPDNLAAVFWRIATATPLPSYGFSWNDASDRGVAVLSSYSGVDTTTPIAAISHASGTSGTNVAAPAQNPARSPTRLVVATTINSTAVMTGPAGMTAHGNIVATNSGARLSTWDELVAGTGSTGTRTTAWTGSNDYISFSLILQGPASGTSDPTVTLTWTPPGDAWVTDYDVIRGASITRVAGRITFTWVDTSTVAASGYTYSLKSIAGSWSSSGVSVNVAACP